MQNVHAVFSSSTFLSILAIVVFCDIRLTRRSFLPPPQIAHPGCRDHVTRTPHRETRRTWQRRERAQSNLSYLARILTFWSSLRCPICKPTSADARHAAWPLTESLAGARRRHAQRNPTIELLTCHAHVSIPRLAAAETPPAQSPAHAAAAACPCAWLPCSLSPPDLTLYRRRSTRRPPARPSSSPLPSAPPSSRTPPSPARRAS